MTGIRDAWRRHK
ncbi:hypothetical protein RDI58_013288 [Solanum bulbocastanum]|uniref:Uncharacterized protein n=2 Tax=Solanaceae TaxID=4070 RepID=A0AAN8TRE7_SOLBU